MPRTTFLSLVFFFASATAVPSSLDAQDEDLAMPAAPEAARDEASGRERIRRGAATGPDVAAATEFAETTRVASDAGRREVALRRAQEMAPFDLGWGLP